jgi:hypothetical protein
MQRGNARAAGKPEAKAEAKPAQPAPPVSAQKVGV